MKSKQKTRPNFDQFLLIGIPPNGSVIDDNPTVLAAYPPFELPELKFQTLIDYALPNGCIPTDQPVYEKVIYDMFVFSFKCHDVNFYGTTVLINPINIELPFYVSEKTQNSLFAFTIISRNTFISSHFTFLTFMCLLSSFKIKDPNLGMAPQTPEQGKQITIVRMPDEFKDYQVTNFIGHHPDVPIPLFFSDPIHMYFRYNGSNGPLTLSANYVIQTFASQIDKEMEDAQSMHQHMQNLSFDTLFSLLSPSQVITLVCGLLLDRQIVIIGSRFQEITMCVIALTELIAPINYTGVSIPILPTGDKYSTLLEAPTPFIIGTLPTEKITTIEFDETAIFVNLDNREMEITVPIPRFPKQDAVIRKLKRVINVSLLSKPSSFSFPSFFRSKIKQNLIFSNAAIIEIPNIIRKPLSNVLTEEIYGFFMTNLDSKEELTTEFNKDVFLSIITDDQKEFYLQLFESQSFSLYLQNILESYATERGHHYVKPRKSTLLRRKSSRKISSEFLNLKLMDAPIVPSAEDEKHDTVRLPL